MWSENFQDCQSQSRLAVSICFSHDCTRTHNFVPIRLCQECVVVLHSQCETPHLVHRGSGCVWGQPVMWDTVEGIVKLMRETAQFEGTEGEGKRPKWLRQLEGGHSLGKEIDTMADERRMLSRFGVWMMAALCPPNQNADQKSISYIMYNVFQWFATTALLPNDSMGASLEQLKTDFLCDWINMAIRIHYEVFISALSPNPEIDGQHFEQIKEGLGRLLALMPYDVISIETWSRVMPQWLQLIYEKCTEEQQHDLKILLCKIFEPDLCPLPFETALLLSRLEISIPLNMLLENFSIALGGLSAMEIPQLEQNDLEDDSISIHIVIIDILVLQVLNNFLRLNEIVAHEQSPLTEKLFECVSLLLSVPLRTTDHECKNPELDGFADCSACQQAAFLHQMVMNMTENVSPKQEMAITAAEDEPVDSCELTSSSASHPSTALSPQTAPGSKTASPPVASPPAGFTEGGLRFQTAVVEHTGDDEFVGVLPAEEDSNSPNQQQQQQQQQKNPPDDFVTTSVGRFRFCIDQLPPQLKMIHALLVESMMVPKLWARLRSDFAQVGELASLLLLHCISFPSGEEAFWRAVHKDFTCPDWKTRFDAVGKAYVMGHVTKMAPVKGNKVVQTALSALFYHFVTSLHDPNPAVAQRAIIALRALPTQTLKMICFCFESQFDSCIIDRPIIVNTIRLLTTQLPDETMLTFDFFIQRFETLVLESQLCSESEETIFVQGNFFHNHDRTSTIFYNNQKKGINKFCSCLAAVLCLSRLPHWRRRGRLSEAALSCRMKIRRVVTMVKVVNRWRQMAADITVGAASLVSLIATSGPRRTYSTTAQRTHQHDKNQLCPLWLFNRLFKGPYSRLREFVDEESNLCLLFNRVVDMENPERHTVYLVVSLFVSFLSNKNSTPTDEKANAKKQSLLFRHFNTLIGFSNTEKCFTIPPARLRISVVCNAFLSGLPEILDCNLCIGNQLLPTVVQLLLHLPSPQKLASDQHQSNYSLKLLPQHSRHLWLNSFILILYKYRFDQVPISDGVLRLINVVAKTLEAQAHVCSETDQPTDIVTWDDISEEESDSPKGMIRPESLTVTTIQVSVYFSHIFRKNEHEGEQSLYPTIVEPRGMRKRSEAIKRKEPSKQRKSSTKRLACFVSFSPFFSVELRCDYCNESLTSFDEETISLCLIAVETFLHREPVMAAPSLFSLLRTVTRLIDHPIYPWHDSEMFVPGNCRSVAKQMLRVTLHQLSSSGICMQLFDTPLSRMDSFWKIISLSLADFQELSPVYFIQLLFEISSEGGTKPTRSEMESAITVMSHVLKVQNFSTFKSAVSLVDSFCKWLAEALHECPVKLESLLTACTACNRALIRERDKQSISRAVVAEMIQAIKFKCPMHERNFITIAHLILQDAGEDIEVDIPDDQFNTAASEAVRPFLFEILDFIADLHVLAKLKKETNSDTVGGDLKVKLAEAIAVEMSRSNARDCRTVIRFIPWLMSPPSVTQVVLNP
uniref:Protein unc-79 homolog n=1 Tax=Angiostrongylus cantonensis TaxID=6313 RepID=A0A158PBJ8_ANGCA